jgi:hypothetical protein
MHRKRENHSAWERTCLALGCVAAVGRAGLVIEGVTVQPAVAADLFGGVRKTEGQRDRTGNSEKERDREGKEGE